VFFPEQKEIRMTDKNKIRKDAEGQFARTREGRSNNGVASAKPRVITHSDDATAHRTPPGQKSRKDWDINYDEGGKSR
jgi:hypothetical protein